MPSRTKFVLLYSMAGYYSKIHQAASRGGVKVGLHNSDELLFALHASRSSIKEESWLVASCTLSTSAPV